MKRILEKRQVQLIKHLLRKGHAPLEVSRMTGLIGRTGVSHIKHNRRWTDIETPSYNEGEELWFKLLNNRL